MLVKVSYIENLTTSIKIEIIKLVNQENIDIDKIIGLYYYNSQGIVIIYIYLKEEEKIFKYSRMENAEFDIVENDFSKMESDMTDFNKIMKDDFLMFNNNMNIHEIMKNKTEHKTELVPFVESPVNSNQEMLLKLQRVSHNATKLIMNELNPNENISLKLEYEIYHLLKKLTNIETEY